MVRAMVKPTTKMDRAMYLPNYKFKQIVIIIHNGFNLTIYTMIVNSLQQTRWRDHLVL